MKWLELIKRVVASPWEEPTPTPDQIIVAHILQSIVKQPDDWRWRTNVLPVTDLIVTYDRYGRAPDHLRGGYDFVLIGPTIEVVFKFTVNAYRGRWKPEALVVVTQGKNDAITLATEAGNQLTVKLSQLWGELAKAKEIAINAKATMELNEKKWNLVEQLLGMKRNEAGALVMSDD